MQIIPAVYIRLIGIITPEIIMEFLYICDDKLNFSCDPQLPFYKID